jgi:hypothetical protein
MRKVLLPSVSVLVVAVLFCLGFSPPAQAQSFTITLTESSPRVCNSTGDTSPVCNIDSAAGTWSFSAVVTGKVSFLGLQIKNNPGPGDICDVYGKHQPKGNIMVTFSGVPAAAMNVCGNRFTDTNGEPLALFAYIQTADPSASVTITVTYPVETAALSGSTLNRRGLQLGTLARLGEQGGTLAQLPDPVVDVCRRRVLLG